MKKEIKSFLSYILIYISILIPVLLLVNSLWLGLTYLLGGTPIATIVSGVLVIANILSLGIAITK